MTTPTDRPRPMRRVPMALRVELWKAINAYVEACGGNPDRGIYGATTRQGAAVDVEGVAEAIYERGMRHD